MHVIYVRWFPEDGTYVNRNHLCNVAFVSMKKVGEVTKQVIMLRQLIRSCNSFLKQRKGLRITSFNISDMSCFKINGSRYQNCNLPQKVQRNNTIMRRVLLFKLSVVKNSRQ